MSRNNNALLQSMLKAGKARIEPDSWLIESPDPLPISLKWDRIEGMLLGLAIGDSLGNTTEGRIPVQRMVYGEIRDYLPHRKAGGRAVGLPSDDTQMAFWTLEQLLADDGLDPDSLARRFTQAEIYGIGSTVRNFIKAYKETGVLWDKAGQESAGNGALMRIAPVLLPHINSPAGLRADAVLAGMVTHNDRASNAACVAFVQMLWETLRLSAAPLQGWWVKTFITVAARLEGSTHYEARSPMTEYRGTLWKFVNQQVRTALEENLPALKACDQWGSGAYLLETVPSVLYILEKHGDDPEEAIVRAANDTYDNDTIAAIVGAAVGALYGRKALPDRWVKNLLGRTGADDDHRVFDLIEQARHTWGVGH